MVKRELAGVLVFEAHWNAGKVCKHYIGWDHKNCTITHIRFTLCLFWRCFTCFHYLSQIDYTTRNGKLISTNCYIQFVLLFTLLI